MSALGAAGLVADGASGAGGQVGSTTVQTFGCTGERVAFTVPSGVDGVSAKVHGAQGGSAGGGETGNGGQGGLVQAFLPVNSGQTIYLFVGCYGERGPLSQYGGSVGGSRGSAADYTGIDGAGGGGSSEIWSAPEYVDGQAPYLVVAGGGGGGGGAGTSPNGNGGAGGDGGDGGFSPASGQPGGGAPDNGSGGCNTASDPSCTYQGVVGGDGEDVDAFFGGGAGGGGGGSSISGGGGGSGGGRGDVPGEGGGGGGAGGASDVSDVWNWSFGTSPLQGDGRITLSWEAPASPPPGPSEPLAFVSVAPERLLDTRSALGDSRTGGGARAGAGVALGAGQVLTFPVAGSTTASGTVIPDDAVAVMVNATISEGSEPTFVTMFPSGTARPEASTLNAVFGADSSGLGSENVANMVTVRLGVDGGVSVYNHAGTIHVIADIAGYYVPID